MNIYLFFIITVSGFTITAKVSRNGDIKKSANFSRPNFDENTGKNSEISPGRCKTLFKSVKKDLSKSRPVNKLTIKILLKYCMTETRLKLLATLTSKAKKDSLRW